MDPMSLPGTPTAGWHGRRPGTHRPSPGPPDRVGEASLVGVGGRLHGNPWVMAAYRCHTAHPGPAEVAQARKGDRLGSVGGSCASFRPPGRNVLRTAPRQHATARVRSSGPALAQRAGMRTPCALGSTCAPAVSSFGRRPSAMAATRSDGRLLAGAGQMGPNADRSPRRRRARVEGELCRGSTSTLGPRPRAYTPGAMVARAWSGLMCLETQGTRGGRPALDLLGAAESLTHGRLKIPYISEFPRWACLWRRSASRCIPAGRSGRNVGMGTGVADGPEVRRAGRRLGLKNMGPSAGRVGALGGSPEMRRNSNFDRVASFKISATLSTSATFIIISNRHWARR